MPLQAPPTSNDGVTFYNPNQCHNGLLSATSTYQALSNIACGEVIISSTNADLYIIQSNDITTPFVIKSDNAGAYGQQFFTFRGVTNANQLSARVPTGVQLCYYRTQFYSLNPVR